MRRAKTGENPCILSPTEKNKRVVEVMALEEVN